MTQATYAPNSLEMQAQQLGARYSLTSSEREVIAADVHALLTAYELQGGRYPIEWLKRHMKVSHGHAVNLRNAGLAISRGAPTGTGVSHLAQIGVYIRRGMSLPDALSTAADGKKRQEAAQQAGIGVGKVSYPTDLAPEMASSYNTLARTYAAAGLTPPPVEEMTVMMSRLAISDLTPAKLRAVELGEAIGTVAKPDSVPIPSFYEWLHQQPCAISGVSGVELHHLHVPGTTNTEQGRRHADKTQELLLPLSPRYHQTARQAAHSMNQAAWSNIHFGHEFGAYLRAAQYLTEYMQAHGLLRGK